MNLKQAYYSSCQIKDMLEELDAKGESISASTITRVNKALAEAIALIKFGERRRPTF